jgi:uncharacterized protein YndB with AHSA1/START domain
VTSTARLEDGELIARCDIAAAPVLVWRALTMPDQLVAFWGGNHAKVVEGSVRVDLRPGGVFELETTDHRGHGRHRLHFVYLVIDEPTTLVFIEPRTGIVTTMNLDATVSGGTAVTVHQRRLPPELRTDQAARGLAGILDRLASHLADATREENGAHK